MFNIRGADVSFNPVVIAYAVVTTTAAHLFVDARKLGAAVIAHLGSGVTTHPYEDIEPFLTQLAGT